MKKEIATLFLMTSVWAAQAQGTFTIEGQVKNVEDGALITLFRLDGNVGSSIGVDTIRNGHFRFQAETLGNETEIVDMMGRSDKFPSMSLRLWVRPGDNIRVSGENTLIRTWNVESTVPEQVANQAFINDSRELWNEYQRNSLLQRAYRRKYAGSAVDEERQAIRAQADSLRKLEDEITIRIDANTIKRMKQIPVDDIWLEQLEKLAMSAKYTENYPYKEEVIALYEGLTDGEKQSGIERINLDVKYLRGERDAKMLSTGKYITENSLLILVDGENSGEVFQTPTEGYQGSTFKQLSINNNMNTDYMLQVINLHRKTLRENKVGSAIPHLNKKLFRAIEVPMPPYDEQHRIINVINVAYKHLDAIMENL
jgi:hypothetical protein